MYHVLHILSLPLLLTPATLICLARAVKSSIFSQDLGPLPFTLQELKNFFLQPCPSWH